MILHDSDHSAESSQNARTQRAVPLRCSFARRDSRRRLHAALVLCAISVGGAHPGAPINWTATTLSFLRVQKTASKSLVDLLQDSSWLATKEQGSACPRNVPWFGQSTPSCKLGLARVFRQGDQQRTCLLDGHCAIDTLVPPGCAANGRAASPLLPPAPCCSVFVVALLRHLKGRHSLRGLASLSLGGSAEALDLHTRW